MKYAELGTVIEGTMEPDDLIPAFRDTLESLDVDGKYKKLIYEVNFNFTNQNHVNETNQRYFDWKDDVVVKLSDALNEYAPPHCYFGPYLSDGADYGFWMFHLNTFHKEWFNETCKVHTISEGENGESEFLDLDCMLHVEVNALFLIVSTIGRGKEIFSIG